jgi:glutamyl-tRNA synthetase
VHPLRLALTGGSASPGIDQVLFVMGRERVLARIDAAVAFLGGKGTQ